MIGDLNIIQYNCGNANGSKARWLLDSVDPKEYPIIAIQEPGVTEARPRWTYIPKNFTLGREPEYGRKVAFLIHDKVPLTSWQLHDSTDHVELLTVV